jgi:hypothetical protein
MSYLDTSFFPAAQVERIAADHRDAGLEPIEVSIMDFAGKVARDAMSMTESDVDAMRARGLDEREIFQIVLAAAVRCFFSTVLDATGTEPDEQFGTNLDPGLQQVLAVGRAIAAPSS